MTFSVNGIKQAGNEKYTIDILVCVDAPLLVRKILSKTNILILSLKEYSEEPSTFGDIYFTINLKFQEIKIVTKHLDIQETADFFTLLGFDIQSINSQSKPFASKEVTEIINKAKANAAEKKTEVWKQIREKEDEERKVYQDANLESAKKIIARVFEKIESISKRKEGKLAIQDSRKIASLSEELKKLRMGTNFEKIRETIQEIFKLLEKINKEYYEKIQTPDITISSDSLVTPMDVDREIETLENIQLLKSLGAKVSLNNQDYAILGPYAIFWKFFQKDFVSKISDIGGWLFNLFDIAEFILIIITSILGVYVLANEIYLFSVHQYGLVFSLISIGVW